VQRNQDFVELVDDRGFADARAPADQQQSGSARRKDAVKSGEQRLDLALSPVQLLGYEQPIRVVVLTERELSDGAHALPFGEAAPEIALHPAAVWYRSSGVFASSFMTIAETCDGMSSTLVVGDNGFLAMWQCTHSIGSVAVKGRLPVSA
jgi:hypothetical protein